MSFYLPLIDTFPCDLATMRLLSNNYSHHRRNDYLKLKRLFVYRPAPATNKTRYRGTYPTYGFIDSPDELVSGTNKQLSDDLLGTGDPFLNQVDSEKVIRSLCPPDWVLTMILENHQTIRRGGIQSHIGVAVVRYQKKKHIVGEYARA
jgi:hypothetical protein